jgi:hypothetical protein
MAVNDRLAFVVEIRNVGGGWGGNNSRTVTVSVDAASGSNGDTFANFVDAITFGTDAWLPRTQISSLPGHWTHRHLLAKIGENGQWARTVCGLEFYLPIPWRRGWTLCRVCAARRAKQAV